MKGPLPSQALKLAATMSLLGIWIAKVRAYAGIHNPSFSHRPPLFKFCYSFFFFLRGGRLALHLPLPRQRKAQDFGDQAPKLKIYFSHALWPLYSSTPL